MRIEIGIKPLSVNQAWQGRRFATDDYEAWTDTVLYALRGQERAPEGLLTVRVVFYLTYAATTDVDNLLKPLLDALTKGGVWKDDRLVYKLIAEKVKSKEEKIELVIEPYEVFRVE